MTINLYITSLYYYKDIVTGANKRFDELGDRLIRSDKFNTFVVVQDGQCPSWCPEEKVIYIRPYSSKLTRLLAWLHLSWVFIRLPKGVVYSDFQPIPILMGLKHVHYQLIHDLRNWTGFARGGLGKLSTAFQRRQLRKANKIVTVSQFSKSDIVDKCSIPKDNIFVSYNGITNDYFPKIIDRYIYDFIYIATFEPRKNHINLIKAIEQFSFPVKLCLIGRDLGSLSTIKEYIEKSDSDNLKNIDFINNISETELIRLYQQTKVFVSPSYLEGFGMPLIEAAACGTKVCCSDIEVFKEIMADNASYFDPSSVTSINSSLVDGLSKQSDTQFIDVDKFKWDRVANELNDEFFNNY